ncbi:MAG TPA: glycosyltransferase family 4 protein [Terriglobales bacterium]|nr:glycosyltransferase family 4 protein [Terriglobales bacterium]
MHVLMTADTVGGVWTYTRELVSELIRRGYRVTLVSFGKLPCTYQIAWMQGLSTLDYRPTPFALEWMQDSAADIQHSTKYLQQVIAEVQPDLLHFNQFAYGALKTDLPKVVVAHSDVVSWWVAVRGEQPPKTDWTKWYRDLVYAGLAGADEVIAPSRWMMSNVQTHYVQPARARVVYNGRDPSLFDARSEKHNQVVSVGRVWDEAKQISLLLERAQTVPVLIVGSQKHPDKALGEFTAHSVPEEVTFCGQQSEQDIQRLFATSSIYAACSRYEPFGLAPVEAAMSGCAVIANDTASFRELWGDSAYYFKTDNAESLAAAISTLSQDRALRQQYSQRAYCRAIQNFIAERMVDAYEEVYGGFLAQESAA